VSKRDTGLRIARRHDVPAHIQNLVNVLDNTIIYGQRLAPARPAYDYNGRVYWATDTKTLSITAGGTWWTIYQDWRDWTPTLYRDYQGSSPGSIPYFSDPGQTWLVTKSLEI
jgi:hypothetical protein